MRGKDRKIFKVLLALFVAAMLFMGGVLLTLILAVQVKPRVVQESKGYFIEKGDQYVTNYERMVPQSFPVVKDSNTFRVFMLGGSQAMGTPYVHQDFSLRFNFFGLLPQGGGICTWLEEYFKVIFPGKKIEVINAAVGGEDLLTAKKVYTEVTKIGQPDLVIIMSGNNEFFRHYNGPESYPNTPEKFDSTLKLLVSAYASSLSAIQHLAESTGTPTLLLTIPTNIRDWLPLAFDQKKKREYTDKIKNKEYQKLIDQIGNVHTRLSAIDHYYLGKAYDLTGNTREALKHYLLAKDFDPTFYRTHTTFNQLIRQAKGTYVRVLDMEVILRQYTKDGIPGYDLFHDWCHMKLKGNEIFAKEIVQYYAGEHHLTFDPNVKIALSDGYRRRVKLLYFIKKIKWWRLKWLDEGQSLGSENIENVKKNY